MTARSVSEVDLLLRASLAAPNSTTERQTDRDTRRDRDKVSSLVFHKPFYSQPLRLRQGDEGDIQRQKTDRRQTDRLTETEKIHARLCAREGRGGVGWEGRRLR